MRAHGCIDWCNTTANSILPFPPFSSLSLILPQAPLPRPIMLCSCSKIDATCMWGALLRRFVSVIRKTEPSLTMVVQLNYTLHFVVVWNWKWASDRRHFYHFTMHYPPQICTPMLVFFPVFLRNVGCRPLLDVNWSVCNPYYTIQQQRYLSPFTKPQWCRVSRPYGKTTAADNQWWSIHKPTIQPDYPTIWSTSSLSTRFYLYIYTCVSHWNITLKTPLCFFPVNHSTILHRLCSCNS